MITVHTSGHQRKRQKMGRAQALLGHEHQNEDERKSERKVHILRETETRQGRIAGHYEQSIQLKWKGQATPLIRIPIKGRRSAVNSSWTRKGVALKLTSVTITTTTHRLLAKDYVCGAAVRTTPLTSAFVSGEGSRAPRERSPLQA